MNHSSFLNLLGLVALSALVHGASAQSAAPKLLVNGEVRVVEQGDTLFMTRTSAKPVSKQGKNLAQTQRIVFTKESVIRFVGDTRTVLSPQMAMLFRRFREAIHDPIF